MGVADEAIIEALVAEWRMIDERHRLQLRRPILALHGGRARLGLWMRQQRTISISRDHALGDPWLDVAETLLHEVAHQIVDERLGGDTTPHGPRFQRVLADLGAVPRASAEPPKVVDRVRKLLALAGSPNQHEAELAMAKARRLMLANRLEAAKLDASRGYVRGQMGDVRGRLDQWRSTLASTIGRHFFVEVVICAAWMPERDAWGSAFEIVGAPEDVEMATWAYDFVVRTVERLWKRHLAAHPGAGRSRQRFLVGAVMGFRDRLDATDAEAREEGLVLVGDPALEDLWTRRHPSLRHRRGSYRVDEHFHAGQAAGGDVVLHRPIQSGSDGTLRQIG
ncbi:MAG: DUF2786 domain-containing protein [Myxococcales bacterium]|nr:DUF2786 domain-containing protein [Myxococcales bacterium]MCB9668866.1 DUF2786 domain-containing protein [Alphaproteobacteria bacterium]MCB9691192.1 DUF2786 domain-containing protein [Alphaproteobacteria bacterium]